MIARSGWRIGAAFPAAEPPGAAFPAAEPPGAAFPAAALLVGLAAAVLLTACPGRGSEVRLEYDRSVAGLRGVWHTVRPGETLEAIADRYGAVAEDIAEVNDLMGDPEAGSEIFIPGAVLPEPARPPRRRPRSVPGVSPPALPGGLRCLAWPVKGTITSPFGRRGRKHHDGMDIAAPTGTPVWAAGAGRVLYSDSRIRGYGEMVVIEHATGFFTVYAHLSERLVLEGDSVALGALVGRVGATGAATGPHLHFEVRVGESARNPRRFLAPWCRRDSPGEGGAGKGGAAEGGAGGGVDGAAPPAPPGAGGGGP